MIEKRRAERIARADRAHDFHRNRRRVNDSPGTVQITAFRSKRQQHHLQTEATTQLLRVIRQTEHRGKNGKFVFIQFHNIRGIQRLLNDLF